MSNGDRSADDDKAGRHLWQSARNLVTATDELDALLEQLVDDLEAKHDDVRLTCQNRWEELDGSDWIEPGWAVDFRVERPNGRKKSHALGIASLCLRLYDPAEEGLGGDEVSWRWARVPKLFCAFWPRVGKTDATWDASKLSLHADGTSDGTTKRGRTWRRTVPVGRSGEAEAWFFCVPVAALTEANLHAEVVEPFLKLLANNCSEVGFPARPKACEPPAPKVG